MTNGTYAAICPAIAPSNQLEIATSSLPNGTAKQTYSATLRAIGSGNYTWSLSAALPSGLALNALTGVISGTPQSGAGPLSLNVSVLDNISHLTVDAILSLTIDSPTLTPATVYSYTATYDHVGNVTSYTDQVMGQWNFTYDSLNRLASGVPQTGAYSGQKLNLCMNYDSFGNRTQSDLQTTACAPATDPATAKYSAANRVTWTTVNSASNGLTYDAAGNVLNDGANWYAYDGEGRVCAVQSAPYSGGLVAYGYIYDAEGRRVGKGTITPSPLGQQPSCNMTSNNFKLTESYVLGQGGEQLTTLTQSNGASTWQSTNVYGEGKLLATYDTAGLHFQLTDPLGTRRVQTNSAAEAELDCQSLPFGDQQPCFPDPSAPNDDADEDATGTQTPIHFTNKQHDTESGNDYFGARYYSSNMGRFMSPDSVGGDPTNPQSWNLYSYVWNNPLKNTDPDGHNVNVCTSDSNGNQQCHEISNEQYQAAQQGNGSLNVPTLNQVGKNQTNGTFNATAITDSNGNTVGTATYVPTNPGIDPFVGNNMAGYQTLNAANTAVTYATVGTAVAFGGVAVAAAAPEAAAVAGRWGLQRLAMGASSPALLNLINRLYQAQDEIPGGTAGAVRNEVMTGEYINGGHSIKAAEMITALTRLINSGELSGSDQTIAGHIISDLKNSLGR